MEKWLWCQFGAKITQLFFFFFELEESLVRIASYIFIILVTGCEGISASGQESNLIPLFNAPAPAPIIQKNGSATQKKLLFRKTINVFRAWNAQKGRSPYGLYWTARPVSSPTKFSLMEIYWNYHYVGKPWSTYPGQEPFITEKKWSHADEYGKTVWLDYLNSRFPPYFANLTHQRAEKFGSDGLMLDWWHNDHPGNVDKTDIARARRSIASAVRKRMGDNFIILANVNWRKDKSTHDLINGVFLELYKHPYRSKEAYTYSEIREIEKVIDFHNTHLREPRLIALEPWRITNEVSDGDRNSEQNRKYAKLFTAMAAVIPENGYILYADNNSDTPNGDHDHFLYDFYDIDLGKPVSRKTEITDGIAYKLFESGLVVYNLTKRPAEVKFQNGKIYIAAFEGLICKELSLGWNCV
ncbi:MAG: hypothetical protein CFH41_00819 [Alphaproteobacteria bacterium MarineAlpha11_Bin1]|nr:MAG: hypothetical protein CFH41_00819 [Alphaproteobacteria bacterium MarineAlpha11_Bin1]|tara:strand:+ start:1631 stop:2866 length:1236 start_codon:yes stop_codon:yes gene_type:complete